MSMSSRLRRRTPREPDLPGVWGTVRIDVRTKDLTKRLKSGDIAVIDHQDIDKVSAEALLACKPAAVINAGLSMTGRYPNMGPEILMDAGVPLLDNVGSDVLALKDGQTARLDGDTLYVGEVVVAKGILFDQDIVAAAMIEARAGLAVQLEAFAANTMEYLRRERALLFDGVGVPDIKTVLDGRHALVVVRGYHYKDDLQTLRHYIREFRPILIGVDGGADALLEAGHRPTSSWETWTRSRMPLSTAGQRSWFTPIEMAGRQDWSVSASWVWIRCSFLPPAPARMLRCCWPTTRGLR